MYTLLYDVEVHRQVGITQVVCTCRHIKKCIVDKNARIGQNVKLINKDGVTEAQRENDGLIVKDGIIVVIKDAAIPSDFEF